MGRFLIHTLHVTLAILCSLLSLGFSQVMEEDDRNLRLRGRVILDGVGIDSGMVVLHRVSPEMTSSIDSISVSQDGNFGITTPWLTGNEYNDEVLFASFRYEEVFYFGSAISDPEQMDSLYLINVFSSEEASSGSSNLSLSFRNLFLEQWEGGWHATDIFQISNNGMRTIVSDVDNAVWTYPIPSDAISPKQLNQGGLPFDMVTFEKDRILVWAPLPPGERTVIIRYELPNVDVEFPAPGTTETLELLVREPSHSIAVKGLNPINVVSLGMDRSYRRYSGIDVRDTVIYLAGVSEQSYPPIGIFTVLLGVILVGVGLLFYVRPQNLPIPHSVPNVARNHLVLQVAQLDELLDSTTDPEARKMILKERRGIMECLQDYEG